MVTANNNQYILMQGDCLERMQDIPDGSVDMVLCDLPYGITQSKWDVIIPFDKLWEQYHRITKPNSAIVLHCQQPFTTQLIASNLKEFKYCWVWNKHYVRGFLNAKKMPLKVHEDIAVFYRKQCTYNPQMTKGLLRSKNNSATQRGSYGKYKALKVKNDTYYPKTILDFAGVPVPKLHHPNQKPVELLEYLIKTYTNAGGAVLDNCMGSGSTGVAAMNLDRYFIGIEKDENYFNIAYQRIQEAMEQKENKEAVSV